MTHRSGLTKAALLTLMALLTALPVRSQTNGGIRMRQDSVRTALVDSIYRSLNDTAKWEREMEYVRNLSFDMPSDSDLLAPQVADDLQVEKKRNRVTWKEKEARELKQIQLNSTVWEPEPRLAVWFSLLFPGGGQIYNRKFWKLPLCGVHLCTHVEPVYLYGLPECICRHNGR